MADQSFPLPGSSYKEVIKIIQGYGQVSGDAVPSDVSKIIGVHETIVSRNNRFLVAIGVIQGGKKKTMTTLGAELSLALEHNVPDQIAIKWRSLVETVDFFTRIIASVRIRKTMDESSLQAHIAYSAGQPKTPMALTGAAAIVEILKAAGLLAEEGGNLTVATSELAKPSEFTEPLGTPVRVSASSGSVHSPFAGRTESSVQLNIEVRIQCTPEDLPALGQKLRKVIDDFNRKVEEESPPAQGAEGATK